MIFTYSGINIHIKQRSNYYHLEFSFNKKRIRKSTGLVVNLENLTYIKNILIPEIFKALTQNTNIDFINKDVLLKDYSDKFFILYKETLRKHTYIENIQLFNNHIKPTFGDFVISKIKPYNLEEWQNKLIKKYSKYTVRRIRSIFNMIFDSAYKNDLIIINPFSKVSSPIKNTFKKLNDYDDEITPFNNKEIELILDNTKNNLHYFVFIMLCTGMRPGEIISLTWNDVDFQNKRIAVDKTTVKGIVGNVKTSSSVRYVDIIKPLEDKLKEFYDSKLDDVFLFVSKFNKPYFSHIVIARSFKTLLEKLNIRHRNLYNLRHTFASNMIKENINLLWISKMLGHKNIAITQEIYIRFIKEDDKKRLDYLSNIDANFVTGS